MSVVAQATGIGAVDEAERVVRLDVCRNCEHSTKEQSKANTPTRGLRKFSRCLRCPGLPCFIGRKAWIAAEHCPLGKWPGDETG